MQALETDRAQSPPSHRGARFAVAAALCGVLLAMQRVDAVPAPEVAADLRPFLVAAIDASDGRAAGTLAGPFAELLRSRGISAAPLFVEVTTLRTYREPGCKRLNVQFRQGAVASLTHMTLNPAMDAMGESNYSPYDTAVEVKRL